MDVEKNLLLRSRRFIGFGIMLLVPICFFAGKYGYNWMSDGAGPCWNTSISYMYWTSARNIFVALLSYIGITFILYKGYTIWDRIVNIITGFFLIGLILFPTYSTYITTNFQRNFEVFPYIDTVVSKGIHTVCAIGTFLLINADKLPEKTE